MEEKETDSWMKKIGKEGRDIDMEQMEEKKPRKLQNKYET